MRSMNCCYMCFGSNVNTWVNNGENIVCGFVSEYVCVCVCVFMSHFLANTLSYQQVMVEGDMGCSNYVLWMVKVDS